MKKVTLKAVRRIPSSPETITFELRNIEQQMAVANLIEYQEILKKAKAPYYTVIIEPPFRPRTTGRKSQCNRFNGFVRQFAIATGNDIADVKLYCKQRAIRRGYPVQRNRDGGPLHSLSTGNEIPISESEASVEEAGYLIEEIEQLASEFGVILEEE